MFKTLYAISVSAFAVIASASSNAQTISDPNIFTGATVTVSNAYNEGIFPRANINDGAAPASYFQDQSIDSVLTFSNLTAPSGINSIRFYDGENYQVARVAKQVTISSSLDGIVFTPNGSFTLTTGPGGYYDGGVDSNVAATYPNYGPSGSYPDSSTTPGYGSFDTVSGLSIAPNVIAVRLDFGPAAVDNANAIPPTTVGQGFTEIQGFASVPEPSTYAMMLVGGAALLLMARRSRVLMS